MGSDLVLVLNCGSSSVKFAVLASASGDCRICGVIEKIGSEHTKLTCSSAGHKENTALGPVTYLEALTKILSRVEHLADELIAIGHRVVHGGEAFQASVVINDAVISTIEACIPLAPLHNPNNLEGIHAAAKTFPKIPQVAVFDTAFHQSMPKHAYLYPIPQHYYEQYQVRRYGFHGTSHRFVSAKAAEIIAKPIEECAFISVHLGNGCSATAILNGKSVDTSMGLTPLEGLMMGTRSGDVDPGLHQYLADQAGLSLYGVMDLLNKESGLLGVSGTSMDMRDLAQAADSGDENAELARTLFCFRAAKCILALSASLPRLDAIIFTGGIGENDAQARAQILSHLGLLGLSIDKESNLEHGRSTQHCITQSEVKALVIPTNEEWCIAQDAIQLIGEI